MTALELKSEKREVFGKKVRTLRNQGLVPAVVYGSKDNVPLTLKLSDFKKVFKNSGETALVRLFIGGSASAKNVLVYNISHNPITDEINHIDFREVEMDEKITAKVPLVFIGNSLAVSDLGGVLVKAIQELQIRALPSDLPHQIEVDISSLKTFDDNILIKDIKIYKNVEILDNISTSVASVVPPRSEAEIEELSGKVEEKVEDISVEAEEKAAERAKEKTKEVEAEK